MFVALKREYCDELSCLNDKMVTANLLVEFEVSFKFTQHFTLSYKITVIFAFDNVQNRATNKY